MAASQMRDRKGEPKVLTAEETRKESLSGKQSAEGRPSIDTNASSAMSQYDASSKSKSLRSSRTATDSLYSSSTEDAQSIRVYTKGSSLSSGFAYHPALFDMQVHPTRWDEFSAQVVESTKLSLGDNANAWATGILSFTIFPHPWHIGRNQSRRLQEKRVKTGLSDASEGALGDVMRNWNDGYFQERGLVARLELSEEAMRSPDQQSSLISGEAHWHLKKEDRDRHRQERKFVLVVSKLGETLPQEPGVVHELPVETTPSELADVKDAKYHMAEAPGDLPTTPAELPGDGKRAEVPGWDQYAELEANNEDLLKKETLMVTADTHALLNKDLKSG
ncbi:hypothetical protein M409DRAFT_51404 [Zasmidium cellare ATCC 36951]|uniref:Uncharacterized protein n=1 Tax=Zasmidium cellare ATCC 36951 TaxID=1080233 RepID=A0A6A6CTC9_ZASCE|nr:uncharacterized protein M409DRAFT_51404 [Zasmidium cellare ATCC 36951]KAF2170351.1 hypothetical protein M409DRAFT_51404 [Zasmidium cellare ATCC 36951]